MVRAEHDPVLVFDEEFSRGVRLPPDLGQAGGEFDVEVGISFEYAAEVGQVVADYSRWLESSDLPMTHEPEMTKVMVSEMQQRLVDTCMKVLGPLGQIKEGSKHAPLGGRIEWYFLHAFLTTIGGGTSEVGRNVIAQRGLGLPR